MNNFREKERGIKMKRMFAFVLALMMALAMTACSGDGTVHTDADAGKNPQTTKGTAETGKNAEPTELPTVVSQETQADTAFMGNLVDGTYTNSFFGFRCELGESWTYASNEQLGSLVGITAEVVNDEDLAQAMLDSGVVYDMYASTQEGLVTASLAVENMGLVYGSLINEDTYVSISIGQLPAALESMGLTNVTAEAGTVEFAGQEHAAVLVHGVLNGVDFYETMVCIKVDRYMGVVTVSCYYEDITENVLSLFQAYQSK